MDKRDECCSTHLIGGDGNFHVEGIQNFMKEVKFAECGVAYAVVAIMGPQSSGKSTLLNHLFGTNFREMDVSKGRLQTTKGIWLARCVGIEPCTLVMDLEGTDSSERGEDDTAFEKQSALFALAVSDIFLINMWCQDIGREKAANKPLLKTVFQVMMTLFSPRKTTLMFVIRDKTKATFEILESLLMKYIQDIWDSVLKENARKETPLNEFFDVQVVALSSFEYNEEQFKEQVAGLRKRFMHSISPGGLAGDRRGVLPASGFMFSAQQIWKVIKENKDLNLPAHKVMVATVRCEEIADAKFSSFVANEEWRELEVTVQSQPVPGFGKKLAFIIDACLSEYDVEAAYFDESVSSRKRKQLEEKLLQLVQPAYQFMLGHSRAGMLSRFKEDFESKLNGGNGFAAAARDFTEYCISQFNDASADADIDRANWDASEVRDKLRRDIDAHVIAVRATKLSELTATYEKKLYHMLSGPVGVMLDSARDETWPSIRKLFLCKTETAVDGFSRALSGFEIDDATKAKMISSLEDYSRGVVEAKAKQQAKYGWILTRMKDRFSTLVNHDDDSMPRVWSGKEDICAINKTARSASLKLLSVMAAIRLDDNSDAIEKTLSIALFGPGSGASSTTSRSLDPLASSSWGQVEPSKTLLTPVQCKSLWQQFEDETKYIVSQATIAAQEASRNNKWMPVQEIFSSLKKGTQRILKGHTCYEFDNDDQVTASVVLAGLLASLNLVGGTLADHTFLFLVAGEVGTRIAELIALEIAKQTDVSLEEARKKIWLVDTKGLIVKWRMESLQHFKKPWAHEHEPVQNLLDAVNVLRPTILIGSSGAARTFTKEVVEAMASFNEKPVILALSNPTSQSECTAEEAYKWSEGRAIFASGSPFAPVEYNGKVYASGQANNIYIFVGLTLGLTISGAEGVPGDLYTAASEALAGQVSRENLDKGLIYPPFCNLRNISVQIAAHVATKAYELGLTKKRRPREELVALAGDNYPRVLTLEECNYSPRYV